MVQNDKRDQNCAVETISAEDIGSIDNLTGTSPELTPEEEMAEEAMSTEMENIDWSPVENPKIINHLNAAAEAILRLDTQSYRNDGSTKYVAFTKGTRRSVVCVYLSRKSARISVGKLDGKRTTWPKNLNYRVTEEGYHLNGGKVKLTTIVAKARAFVKAKGW